MALTDIVLRLECDTSEAVATLERLLVKIAAGEVKPEDVDVQALVDSIVVVSLGVEAEDEDADSEERMAN